jgi:PhnB protein
MTTMLNRITLADGRLIHVEMQVGPATFMLADEFPEHGVTAPATDAPTTSVFYLHTPDVDGSWQRALDAGAVATRPLADTFWGEREGQLADSFGYRWGLTQHVRDVSLEEMAAAAYEMFASA